jgi:two-component system response regulator ChvI
MRMAGTNFVTASHSLPVLESALGRVILIDGDSQSSSNVVAELSEHGFRVEALKEFQDIFALDVDLLATATVVLNWHSANNEDLLLASELRESSLGLPVVIWTDVPSISRELLALEVGAVDFIAKTRGSAILARRIRSLPLKRLQLPTVPQRPPAIHRGRLSLSIDFPRTIWMDTEVRLTVTEFKVVWVLVEHTGRPLTYREIYDCMHYPGFIAGMGTSGFHINVRSFIRTIRRKFKAKDAGFDAIKNLPHVGYYWTEGN